MCEGHAHNARDVHEQICQSHQLPCCSSAFPSRVCSHTKDSPHLAFLPSAYRGNERRPNSSEGMLLTLEGVASSNSLHKEHSSPPVSPLQHDIALPS